MIQDCTINEITLAIQNLLNDGENIRVIKLDLRKAEDVFYFQDNNGNYIPETDFQKVTVTIRDGKGTIRTFDMTWNISSEEFESLHEIVPSKLSRKVIIDAEDKLSAMAGTKAVIVEAIDDPDEDGALVMFETDEIESSAYLYADGTLFTLRDWQGFHPAGIDAVYKADWIKPDGKPAIMLNGRPRQFLS